MSTTVYVTAQELASGRYRFSDDLDGTVYGEANSPAEADDIVKEAHNDLGAIVIVTTKLLGQD